MKAFFYSSLLLLFLISSCNSTEKTSFDTASLNQKVYSYDMEETNIQNILEAHKGEKIILDMWASWCMDCVKSLPNVAQFQKEYPEVKFIFLSVDDTEENWKNGIAKYMDRFDIKGEQYFFNTGWSKEGNNDFINYIGLDWIPRYMLIDEEGDIAVYYAKKINAASIKKQVEN